MKWGASVVLLTATFAAAAFGAGFGFPGDIDRKCVSPDQLWYIRCESVAQDDGSGLHTLFLNRVGDSRSVPIWTSNRCCDALWSEDSRRIAVTDWTGSNVAEIFLVDVANPARATPLDVTNIHAIASNAELGGHCYYEAIAWEGRESLLIRVFGHTDEMHRENHGYTYYLSVDTKSGQAKVIMKINAEGV